MIIYGIFHYSMRSLYDFTLFFLIKFLGRVPINDTRIAWKFSGPGVSFEFSNQINIEDIYVLVHSIFEKIQLDHFKSKVYLNL